MTHQGAGPDYPWEMGSAEHARAILDAVDGRNAMVHASFLYQCRRCGDQRIIHLGVGVEGPPQMRERGLYIASPFGGPRCGKCGGETAHANFGADRHFAPIDAPPGCWYWAVPRSGIDLKLFGSSVFCGELVKDERHPMDPFFHRSPRAG